LHCSKAKASGDGAGLSYAYRDTLARMLGCSLDTVDRGNAELERAGLLEAVGRRYPHGGAVVYRLNPPSKWTLGSRKSAALAPQNCGGGAAKVRPITKAKKQLKAKEQQTASPAFLKSASEHAARAPEVLDVVPIEIEASKTPEDVTFPVCPEEDTACIALEAQGVSASMSRHLVSKHGARECAYQLERLRRQKKVRNPAAWLNSALLRGDRDSAPIASAPLAPQGHAPREKDAPASVPKALSPEEEAVKRARQLAREREQHDVAKIILATLDEKRQAFIVRCVELEQVPLARVMAREEHLAIARYWRGRRQ